MDELWLGIDIGTSASKGVLVDRSGAVVARAQRRHGTATPRTGWFEHDAEAVWWKDCHEITAELAASYAHRIAAENHSMSDALLATQLALAREQKLTDLGGVVAAAAHELGTPLATIKLVSSELADELDDRPELREVSEIGERPPPAGFDAEAAEASFDAFMAVAR